MKIEFAINLYDKDGDEYDRCILLFVGNETIIKFKSLKELEDFAKSILNNIIPEIVENCYNQLGDKDREWFKR